MIANPTPSPARRRAAGVAATAAALLALGASPAAADDLLPVPWQEVDTTISATCAPTSESPIIGPGVLARTIAVQLRGRVPLRAAPGEAFTVDQLTARFTLDPDLMRPQVVGTSGSLNARLDSLALLADGADPNPATVVGPKAPLDLGTQPVKIASAPKFDAPVGAPNTTFDPVGPWSVRKEAGGVAVGLDPFALTFTYYPEPSPLSKIAPTVTSVACKPQSPWFAKFPVDPVGPALPSITGISPNVAAGGQTVTITGTGLLGATGVTFGGHPAPFKLGSDSELQAVVPTLYWLVPPPPTLQWDVAVTTDAGTSVNTPADDFTYLTGSAPAAPVISTISPSTVPLLGGKVRVTGRGLKGTTSVTVGKLQAKFAVSSDRALTVAAPAQLRRGVYPLQVITPTGTAAGKLVYR